MKNDMSLRITMDILLAVSVIFGWWYISIPFGLICLWMFPYYGEFIVFGFLYDEIFTMGRGLGLWSFAGLLVTTAATIAFSIFKLVVRW
ncbi:MAG: hypothetical protein KGI69_02335 [Patescibacteria group bacterium]|nr:hypothetical protein [Patescibacteria group bacterium]